LFDDIKDKEGDDETFRASKRCEEWHQLVCFFLGELFSSALKMEAICSSETSVEIQWTTRRHIPEADILYNHRCENLKSYKAKAGSLITSSELKFL
jgi:hypothetical protein